MISRRCILRWTPIVALAGMDAALAADELLQDDDSDARAIDYRADARNVDRQRFPAFRAGQACGNCAIYTADAGTDHGACAIVYGKFVSARGWCPSYEKKAD